METFHQMTSKNLL